MLSIEKMIRNCELQAYLDTEVCFGDLTNHGSEF